MPGPVQVPKSLRSGRIANCTLAYKHPARTVSTMPQPYIHGPYLALDFHAVSQMNCELSDVTESMLICRAMVHAEQLGSRVFHEVDGRKGMYACRLA